MVVLNTFMIMLLLHAFLLFSYEDKFPLPGPDVTRVSNVEKLDATGTHHSAAWGCGWFVRRDTGDGACAD
jgi:hypothetical protein